MRVLLLAALVLALLPPASAQEDACSAQAPCVWVVDVDDGGFLGGGLEGPTFNGTVGDWHTLDITNVGDQEHTISFMGMQWTVPSVDRIESEPFQLTQEGTFTMHDQPSGDELPVVVYLGEPYVEPAPTNPATETPAETPAPPTETSPALAFWGVLVLLAAVLLIRR